MSKPKTIIIGGNFRGGTTATAQVFQAAGVYMGDAEAMGYNQEDEEFQKLYHRTKKVNEIKIAALAGQRNEAHDLWGFKYPGVYAHLAATAHLFRNPYVVLVFRDPIAVGKSEQRRGNSMFRYVIRRTAKTNSDMIEVMAELNKRGVPAFPVSFEHLLTRTVATVRSLYQFAGLDADPEAGAGVVNLKDNTYQPELKDATK